MTVLCLVLLGCCAASPLLAHPLRHVVTDPVLPVAIVSVLLLGAAAALAGETDPLRGWRLGAALVLAVMVATTAGSHVVRAVFRLMRREFLPTRARPRRPATVDDADADAPADGDRPEAVLRGGAWIGYLERAAVAASVLASFPEGIALVLAVKGVGRYAELREPNAPEAFIIGTLASMLWATAAAGVGHLLT